MFTLIYEFKLKPTNAQVAVFQQWLEQCRKVYNYALRERKIGLIAVNVRVTLAQSKASTSYQQIHQLLLTIVKR